MEVEYFERDGIRYVRGKMLWPHTEGEGKKERLTFTECGYWARPLEREQDNLEEAGRVRK